MPNNNPPKPLAIGWAGFENSPAAAGHRRRRTGWALNPLREPVNAATAEARRILPEREVEQGLGRKQVKE
jgi:hypothetical protein